MVYFLRIVGFSILMLGLIGLVGALGQQAGQIDVLITGQQRTNQSLSGIELITIFNSQKIDATQLELAKLEFKDLTMQGVEDFSHNELVNIFGRYSGAATHFFVDNEFDIGRRQNVDKHMRSWLSQFVKVRSFGKKEQCQIGHDKGCN